MTDRDALYRAIVARPEDDTPRLVYADWLEENGREEEAEFIRIECRLETSDPVDPAQAELIVRREELRLWLQAHSPGPRLRLKEGWNPNPRGWWYDTARGFPRCLNVQLYGRLGVKGVKRLTTAMEDAFKLLPTRWVAFTSIGLEDLGEFLKQPAIVALDRLTISSIGLDGDEATRMIADCAYLQNLRGLSLLEIGEAGADALGRSKHLGRIEWLSLNTENLTPQAVRSLAAEKLFHNLRNLMLQGALRADAFEELCRLPPLPNLHTLDLSNNSFPVSSWQEFARSKTFPQLTRLELAETDMSDGRMAALAGADGFRLASLDLNACAIGDEGVRALVSAPWIGSLRWLDLASNRLGPTAVTAIARCRKLTEVKHLDLAGNPIGVTGFNAIARSKTLRNLTTLLLSECSLRNGTLLPAHFHEFLDKLDMPNLRHLDLSNMAIGPKAARLLTDEKFRNLTRLGLAGCKLTDAAISALLTSPTLQNLIELRLEDNGLKTGVALLTNRRILPRLSKCGLTRNPIAPDLRRKLARRAGIFF